MSDAIKDRYGYDTEKHPRLAYDVADPVMGVGTLSISDWEDDCMGVMLQGKVAADEIQRLRCQLDTAREWYRRDLHFLDTWIDSWVSKMHRDISDEERGQIADDMCCDWINSGTGASIQETLRTLAALDGEDQIDG